ncbi:MAG: hypothetical protein R3B84_07065 [Zavarzinella sp.]
MFRYQCIVALAFTASVVSHSWAQFDLPGQSANNVVVMPPEIKKPVHRYPLNPEHGKYLVLVSAFKGERGQVLAENFAEFLKTRAKIPAYVFDSAYPKRVAAREERIQAINERVREIKQKGLPLVPELLRFRYSPIDNEFSVFVGHPEGELKTFEAATAYAKWVRELKVPTEFAGKVVEFQEDNKEKKIENNWNPCKLAFASRNPLLAGEQHEQTVEKLDDFTISLNVSEEYSLVHKTKNKYTMVVRSLNGGEFVMSSGASNSGPRASQEIGSKLEQAAMIARDNVAMLRKMQLPAYIYHTRAATYVCVGDYVDKDDPLIAQHAAKISEIEVDDPNAKSPTKVKLFLAKPHFIAIPQR